MPPGPAGQLTSLAASRTALSMSLDSALISLATCFSAFSAGLVHRLRHLALPDDDQGGLPVIDDLPELLDISAGHAPPQVPADPAHGGADRCADDDRGREQDADQRADGGAAPRPVPGGHLILVLVHLALVVLGHHRGVVGADRTGRMQVLDHVVVIPRRRLVRVSADVDEHCLGLRHILSLSLLANPVQPGAVRPAAAPVTAHAKAQAGDPASPAARIHLGGNRPGPVNRVRTRVIGHSAGGLTCLVLPRGTTAAGRAILTCAARLPTGRPGSAGCHCLPPARRETVPCQLAERRRADAGRSTRAGWKASATACSHSPRRCW